MRSSRADNPAVLYVNGILPVNKLAPRHQLAYHAKNQLMITRADGSDTRLLFSDGGHSLACPPAWSGDGKTLYYSHRQIVAIETATGRSRDVTHFPANDQYGVIWHLACSPDNKQLAFLHLAGQGGGIDCDDLSSLMDRPTEICLHTAQTATGECRPLPALDADQKLYKAATQWQHDRLFAVTHGTDPARRGLWMTNMRGENPVLVRGGNNLRDFAPSPTGDRVALADEAGIEIVTVATGERKRFSDFGAHPSWSPDGARIAFVNGGSELWMADVYGGAARKIAWMEQPAAPTKPRGGYAQKPRWSPDSRLLWFSLTAAEPIVPPANLREKLWKETAHLAKREEAREWAVAASLESARWQHTHKTGIIDFGAAQAWSKIGFWTQVAWSPIAEYRF